MLALAAVCAFRSSKEVELAHWQQDLLPALTAAGYAGLWGDPPSRREAYTVGCAVLWRPSSGMRLAWADPLPRALVCEFELSESPAEPSGGGIASTAAGAAQAAGAAGAAPTETAVVSAKGTQRLAVACVHLEGRRGAGRFRIEQLRSALRRLEQRAAAVAAAAAGAGAAGSAVGSSSNSPRSRSRRRFVNSVLPACVVCGDFNSGPRSPGAQLLKRGRLPAGKAVDRGFSLKVGLGGFACGMMGGW